MAPFIIGGIIEVLTLAWCGFILLGDSMSDNPTVFYSPLPSFLIGTAVVAFVVSMYWWA